MISVKRKAIVILDFSASLTQEDCIDRGNRGIYYYDSSKGSLASYLARKFPKLTITLMGVNTNFKYKTKRYEDYRVEYLPCFDKPVSMKVVFNIVSFLYLVIERPLIVYVYSSGWFPPHIGGLIYSKLTKTPLFVDLRDPIQSLIPFSPEKSGRRKLKLLDKLYLAHSNKIIHANERSNRLLKWFPRVYRKGIIVPNCARDYFYAKTKQAKESKQQIFAYWGVIHEARKLDTVIRGFAKAKKSNKKFKAKLYIIGDGSDLHRLKKFVEEHKLPDIYFTGYMTLENLSKFLSQNCSVALIPIPQTEFYQFSSPIKLAEAIALELPILASRIEPHRIVEDNELGLLCDHTEDDYACAFLKFHNLNLNKFRENCRKEKWKFAPERVFKELGESIASYIR